MPYNFAADSFHTKKLCSRLPSSEVRFFYGNQPFCVFETPFRGLRQRTTIILGTLESTQWTSYNVNWTFFARCYGWGVTSDYRFKIGDFAPTGAGWPKFSGRRGRPPPTILLLRKLG